MRRTQIYLTEEQDRLVAQRANEQGTSKADVIRRIIDAEFETGDPEAEARAAIEATAGICADYPDWPEWLAGVRQPGGADAHLRSSGL